MVSFDEAWAVVHRQVRSYGSESISIEKCLGRILAEKIRADRAYPPFNRATMDGYALRLNDFNTPTRCFSLAGEIYPGEKPPPGPPPGFAYKIFTGSAVPTGANLVIRKEDCLTGSTPEQVDATSLPKIVFQDIAVSEGMNIAAMGKDLLSGGDVAGMSGRITAREISVLAALGKSEVVVSKQPSVAIITTGDEIKSVREPVTPYQIRNSNQYLLTALLATWGIAPLTVLHTQDNKLELRSALTRALDCDIVIFNGAVSAGDKDFVPEVLTSMGMQTLFHQVAIRPGRPALFGKFNSGQLVFALPGNPFSCFTTFLVFVDSYLQACMGLAEKEVHKVRIACARVKEHAMTEFFPVSVDCRSSSTAQVIPFNGSGDITACLSATGLAIQEFDVPRIVGGDEVRYISF